LGESRYNFFVRQVERLSKFTDHYDLLISGYDQLLWLCKVAHRADYLCNLDLTLSSHGNDMKLFCKVSIDKTDEASVNTEVSDETMDALREHPTEIIEADQMKGTPKYLAPEWRGYSQVSPCLERLNTG